MQKGQLFNTKPHNIRSNFIPKLEKALTISLVHFYPLSGQLVTKRYDDDDHVRSFQVDCNKGPGARLIHAFVDLFVSDIVSSAEVKPIIASFFDLGEKSINHDGHTRPLLSVQVTELLDGVFIGFTMNHCIADGTSFWHFISTLSEILTQLKSDDINEDKFDEISISQKPIYNTMFPSDRPCKITKVPYLDPDEFVRWYDLGPLKVRIFHFSSESISILKTKANQECGPHNNISSFQALCGLTWRSVTRARHLRPELEVSFALPINARTRINPPLPSEYFRYFLTTTQCISKAGDLLSNGPGHAALLINQTIKIHDDKVTRKMLHEFEEHPFIFRPGTDTVQNNSNRLFIGGSSKFDVYGLEFGLGKALTVRGGFVNMEDGRLIANPGREGRGSVDLEVYLKPGTMNTLELDQEFMSYTL
ncbi:hypothetical protein RND81_09G167100 [Saponaria officinalis]|uniref:HXXXD-type acyl-transferase family protein n=1 Tax=Saponaria officinalis TaxID=3572 RepID=A0AAW1INM6_SAPOF